MTRYSKQFDSYSCGANALANVLKWDGQKINWKSQKQKFVTEVLCGPPPAGTYPKYLFRALDRRLPDRVEWTRVCQHCNPAYLLSRPKGNVRYNIRNVDAALNKGAIIIFGIGWPKWHKCYGAGHFFLVDEKTPAGYYVINLKNKGPARRWIRRNTLIRLIQKRDELDVITVVPAL
jgi:hypothetical protein